MNIEKKVCYGRDSSNLPSRVGKIWDEEEIKKLLDSSLKPICVESIRILPDSIVLGTVILAGISLCKSYGVLLFTMLELMLAQRGLSMVIAAIAPAGAEENATCPVCLPGFVFPNLMRISLVETVGKASLFPSPSMFFLSGVISYMIGAMQQFGREIKSLQGEIQTRTMIASVFSLLFLLALLSLRYSYGCESFGSLLLSLILGFIMGMLLVFQNKLFFGRDGINILNLPMILTATDRGRPMYVCAPSDI